MTNDDNGNFLKVLLAEDDDDSAAAMMSIMEKRNISVVRVADGVCALQELNKRSYDALVTDIRLPEMNGTDLLAQVRKNDPDFPVIIVTAYESLQTAVQAVKLGVQDYIFKPLESIEDLLVPLRKAVRNYHMLIRNNILEEERKKILDNSVDLILVVDLHRSTIEYISRSVETLLGRRPEEFMTHSFALLADIIHPDDSHMVCSLLCETPANERSGLKSVECRMRHKDGGYKWFSCRCSKIVDLRGAVSSMVVNARDITDSIVARDREHAVRIRETRDERMNSLAVLASGIAHDLNNMLGPVRAAADLVEAYLNAAPPGLYAQKIRDCMKQSSGSIDKIVRTVRELQLLSRQATNRMGPVSLNKIIKSYFDSADFMALKTQYKNIAFEVNLCRENHIIKGADLTLHRALMNLAINACQAMPDGGRLAVNTAVETLEEDIIGYQMLYAGTYMVVRVRDTGAGIAAENLDRIFEPFFSTKSKTDSGGSGLGLAIVHGIIKYHSGMIDVRSEPGAGTEFALYFPLYEAESLNVHCIPEDSNKERVLIVDDMREARDIAGMILNKLGYKVVKAESGKEAISLLRKSCIHESNDELAVDLVVLDMALGAGPDGIETYREIVREHPGQKSIIVSGIDDEDKIAEAKRMGIGGYLKKPYTLEELGRAVRAELARAPAASATLLM